MNFCSRPEEAEATAAPASAAAFGVPLRGQRDAPQGDTYIVHAATVDDSADKETAVPLLLALTLTPDDDG